jgi:predicted ester cyclase
MNIKEFAEKFIEAERKAWEEEDFSKLEALVDPNVYYHASLLPEMVGRETYKQLVLGMRQSISNPRHEWKYLTGEGNLFALSYKLRGIFTGEIPGMPIPKGKEFTTDPLLLYRLKKGKIAEVWMNGSITVAD